MSTNEKNSFNGPGSGGVHGRRAAHRLRRKQYFLCGAFGEHQGSFRGSPAANETTTPASDAEETSTVEAADGWTYAPISYPLEDGGTLSYYMIKDLSQKSVLGSWQEHPC